MATLQEFRTLLGQDVQAFIFPSGNETYVCTDGTGEGAFVYLRSELLEWVRSYTPVEGFTPYDDFCQKMNPVTDIKVARDCYIETGIIPCCKESCTPLLHEPAGFALITSTGKVLGTGPDEWEAVQEALDDGSVDQMTGWVLQGVCPDEDQPFARRDFKLVPCTQRVLNWTGPSVGTKLVPSTDVDVEEVLDLV